MEGKELVIDPAEIVATPRDPGLAHREVMVREHLRALRLPVTSQLDQADREMDAGKYLTHRQLKERK